MSGLSFKFSKSTDKRQLANNALSANSNKEDDSATAESVTHLEDKQLKGASLSQPKSDVWVIPMQPTNNWTANLKKEIKLENGVVDVAMEIDEKSADGKLAELTESSKLEREAKALLLLDAAKLKGEGIYDENDDAMPILLKNRIPDGFETDEKLDVSLRPHEDDADYDAVPIEHFGKAMMRGMGWQEGDPIGKSNKRVVVQKVPELRPKGLGLGADRGLAQQLKKGKNGKLPVAANGQPTDVQLTVKKGASVRIAAGPNRDTYGKIESLDEDNARAIVKLAVGGHVISISQMGLQVVTQAEYDRDSKCINKSRYDRMKSESERQFENRQMEENPLAVGEDLDLRQDRKRKKHKSRDKHAEKKSASSSPKRKKSKKKKRKRKGSSSSSSGGDAPAEEAPERPWVRADLRVRCVAEGRHLNAKMRVIDVASIDAVTCRTDDGRLLDGLSQSMLETTIPRTEPRHVMVLTGEQRGEVGQVVQSERKAARAVVQLLRRQDVLVHADFDDICHFVGDASLYL